MKTENKSHFPNYVAVDIFDNGTNIRCPVCGRNTLIKNCPHVLFRYSDSKSTGIGFHDVHPKLAAEVKRFEAKYVGYLFNGEKDHISPAARKLFKTNRPNRPEIFDLASELKLDAERTMVVSVGEMFTSLDCPAGDSVVGFEFPPPCELSKRYKQAFAKPSKS